MTDSHLVSVIMSTYNANPEHLRQAISSILKQTYQNFELIIVNDGSTTINPEEIIKSFSDDRIIYNHMEENQGLTKCL
ncbi:MAG: glycosyltransferase, partial [Caldibacillus sp.]